MILFLFTDIQFNYVALLYWLFDVTAIISLMYFCVIACLLIKSKRKYNIRIKLIVSMLRIFICKDSTTIFTTSPTLNQIINKNIKNYIDIIKSGKNESLKNILGVVLFDYKNINKSDLLYLNKNNYYEYFKSNYTKKCEKERVDYIKDIQQMDTTKKIDNF
jgi:hypothetical protein